MIAPPKYYHNPEYRKRYFLKGYENGAPQGWYGIGCDIGISGDFTVITAVDKNINKQVFMWRFCPGSSKNIGMNYDALEWTYRYFETPLRVDVGGAGASVPVEMFNRGVPLEEWGKGEDKMKFAGENKVAIMDNLAKLIGGKHIELFNLPEIKKELSQVERIKTDSGAMKIKATGKGHDDIPISLGLSCIGVIPRMQTYEAAGIIHVGMTSVWMTEEW